MNPDIFAEWLRRQGHKVIRTDSSYWYEAGPRVYQAFPYHWLIEPTQQELLGLLLKKRAVGLRYSAPIGSPFGCISYHAIYDEPNYTMDILDRRSRQNVRKGLKNCTVAPIPFQRLSEEGWLLENDTASRQGCRQTIAKEKWRRRCLAAADLPGFEAWGALVGDRLVASLLTFTMDDCCEMISQQCHRDYLNARVNNALSFVVTETMLSRLGIRSIFYTLQSLDAPDSIDQFKFRMGYKAKPVKQRVFFIPLAAPVLNNVTYAILEWMSKRRPNDSSLAKAMGLLRFYLNGKVSPEKQDWPECMIHRKAELVSHTN
jgi:hypothetical protein